MGKTVLEVNVTGVEKRRHPNKHYVYIIEVTWSEGTTTVIYRRYSRFFDFQCYLLEKFPVEGGVKDPSQRIIPFLPGKKLLGRSHVRRVAQKRVVGITEYCKKLVRLPPNISNDSSVLEFFEVADEDINPIKVKKKEKSSQDSANIISDPILLEQYVAIGDYNKDKSNECSLRAGQTVEVIEKNENGWWFVNVDNCHEGWVPATFLEPMGDADQSKPEKLSPGKEEVYISTNSYTAQNSDEVTFEKGVLLEVTMKGLDGWWSVRYKGKEGMAPSAYLEKYNQSLLTTAATPTELVSTPKEAAAATKPATKTKSPSAATKSRTIVDAATSDSTRVKSRAARTAPPPRKESIKRKPIKVSTSTRSRDSVSSESAEVYITIADFTDQAGDGLSFKAGAEVQVISKNSTGWWYVQLNKEEGWVPSSYLEKAKEPIRTQDSLTHSNSHNQLSVGKKLTSSRSQDNLDQIDSGSKFSSLEVSKKRNLTSGNKLQLQGTQSINVLHNSRSPDPVRKKTTVNGGLKESRRSPPPMPAAFHKHQTKKITEMPSRHEATKRVVSPDSSIARSQTASNDLAQVLKKRFEGDNNATATVPPVVSPRHKTLDSNISKPVTPNKEKKTPPPRPNQGPQKKVGPARPAISPALKRKMAVTDDTKQQHYWMTCEDYSEVSDGCISFSKGQDVEIIDDSNTDWWYVKINGKEGYAPATFLTKKETRTAAAAEPKPSATGSKPSATGPKPLATGPKPSATGPKPSATGPKAPVVKKRSTAHVVQQPPRPAPRGGGKKRMYKALADYNDEQGGLSFHEGDVLELLDDSDDWWFVKLGTVEGWAPSTYLEPVY